MSGAADHGEGGGTEPRGGAEIDAGDLLLIVTGAHLRAEMADRPLAYRLRALIRSWLRRHARGLNVRLVPVVCSDIWYLNQESLQKRPTISIGGPGVNALSAFFYQKVGPQTIRDQQIVIQMDPEWVDLRVCLWGVDHERTRQAVQLFSARFLEGFLRAAVTQVEPRAE
jgi:hypothetical protein